MAEEFRRRLPDGALKHLKTMPGWWRDILTFRYKDNEARNRPLLVALRNGYFNVYGAGQSILKVGFGRRGEATGVRCRIHRKYVLGKDAGQGYLTFDGKNVADKTTYVRPYNGLSSLTEWVEAALKHAGEEKKGVALIAERNANVIDLEMALPANEPTSPGQAKVANRMDIVALERADHGVGPAFYEAKLLANSELRARDSNPRVLARQLRNYCEHVSADERRDQVLRAYKEACAFTSAVNRMRGVPDHPLLREVLAGRPLVLDPQPRLVVFGFQDHQVGEGSSWRKHEDVLRRAVPLLMAKTPDDVQLSS